MSSRPARVCFVFVGFGCPIRDAHRAGGDGRGSQAHARAGNRLEGLIRRCTRRRCTRRAAPPALHPGNVRSGVCNFGAGEPSLARMRAKVRPVDAAR